MTVDIHALGNTVGDEGVEPSLTESESGVLPIERIPKRNQKQWAWVGLKPTASSV